MCEVRTISKKIKNINKDKLDKKREVLRIELHEAWRKRQHAQVWKVGRLIN